MSTQLHTLRLYGELLLRRPDWSHQLVFASGPAVSHTGLPAAASIAGATTLLVDPDPAAAKAALRQGALDFVVNTLDEALRTLKNEVRKGLPLAVALTAPEAPTLDEVAARGLYPDLTVHFAAPAASTPSRAQLHFHPDQPSAELTAWLATRGWHETHHPVPPGASLHLLDRDLADKLPADDTIRRRWLQRISHYLPRTPDRITWQD